MDTASRAHVLHKSVAQASYSYPQPQCNGRALTYGNTDWLHRTRLVVSVECVGSAKRFHQSMAETKGTCIGEGAMVQNPLWQRNQTEACFMLVNRRMRTRMSGGVGNGREKLPFTRLEGA
jgi:hypothetical protein